MAVLNIANLRVAFGHVRALDDVSLSVDDNEIVTVVGANGAGKSTLMRAVMGLAPVREGTIEFEGRSIRRLPTHVIANRGIALVPEGRGPLRQLTVRENLRLGAFARRWDSAAKHDFDDVLDRFSALRERLSQMAGTLSGGEQQMLVIARALMSRPKLMLLDEPSLGLAPLIVKQIFAAIAELNRREGLTVFLVEQNAYHALKLASRGYVLVNGAIAMSGTGAELLASPEVRAAYLEGGRH